MNLKENSIINEILHHTHVLLAYLDKDFNIQWVNRAWEAAGQQPVSTIAGKNLFELYPISELKDSFRQAIANAEDFIVDSTPIAYKKDIITIKF